MRITLLFAALPALASLPGCGSAAADESKIQEVTEYLLKIVEAQDRYMTANSTFALNLKELNDFDDSLGEPPDGYEFKGGGGLHLAFGYEVVAIPKSSGPHFYVNQSGIVRFSRWGPADEDSDPVE